MNKPPMKYKGLYDFCTNPRCCFTCNLRVTDKIKQEAKRQGRELSTKDTCPHYEVNLSDGDSKLVRDGNAHNFEPFVKEGQ